MLVPSTMVVTPAAMAWAAACPGDVVGARRHFHGIGRKLLGGVAGGHMAMGAHAPLQVHGGRESGKQMAKYSTAAAT